MKAKIRQAEKYIFFCAADDGDDEGKFKTLKDVADHAKKSYDGIKESLIEAKRKMIKEGTLIEIKNGYKLILKNKFGIDFSNPNVVKSFFASVRQNPDIYWILLSNDKYTFSEWVNKFMEMNAKLNSQQGENIFKIVAQLRK